MATAYPQSTLRPRWWETSAAIIRPYLKARGITLKELAGQLDDLRASGFDALELFAPCEGGICYNGRDTLDFYRVDPAIRTLDDFKHLVAEAHARGMAVISFINLGYGHEQFPAFLKACDDVRQGIDSPEVRWFVWSDTGTDKMDKPLAPHFLNDSHGNWRWNERAGKYFWVKWEGEQGGYHLPQFNYGDAGWQHEVRRIIDFWLGMGIDGFVIDAVNWYIDCNWEITRFTMTQPIEAADNQLSQPEGAGGFGDDPVPWVTQGGFNCVMDYAIKLWWEGKDLIRDAVLCGAPGPIEAALRGYRDRVVEAGGVCYIDMPDLADAPPAAQLLGVAVVATVGEWFLVIGDEEQVWPASLRQQIVHLLQTRRAFPALCAGGKRTVLNTSDDHKFYAFVRAPREAGASVLVVMNFQPDEQRMTVNLSNIPMRSLKNVMTNEERDAQTVFEVTLSAYGFELWMLQP